LAKRDINNTFDEPKNKYEKQRLDVMSPDQQELAEKVQTWYRDAYFDKDERGIFAKMETADLYWEGDAHPPESDTDPASNTNIVNSTIEGQVAYLVEQNLAIEAKPRGPSDLAFRDKAVILMDFCKEQNKMRRKLDVHERRRKKFGTGIFRVLFNPDALDGLGLAEIESLNPAYVFPDPVITDIYKIQEGRFMIETINRSIDSARHKYGDDLADAITPGYYPMEYEDLFNEFNEWPGGEIAGDHYLHFLVWTHAWVDDDEPEEEVDLVDDMDEPDADSGEDGESAADDEQDDRPDKGKKKILRLIEMSACGVILRDTLADDVVICEDDNRFPYFFTPDMYREGTVWAKSTAELLIPVQDTVDDIEDQIVINGRLTGNPQRLIGASSGIDPDKLTNEPGLGIPTDDMNGMKFMEPPSMPNYIIQHRNQKLQYERVVVGRWSDQMNGVKQSGVDTATESLGLQQAGTQNITHDKILLEETLTDVFTYSLTLMMENYTETEVFAITDKPGEFAAINASEMRNIPQLVPAPQSYQQNFAAQFPQAQNVPQFMPHPENLTKRIALDISVKVGAGLPSNKAFIFQMIDKAFASKAITPQEYRKLLREYTGLPIDEEPPMPPQPPQPMPGMGGAMQNPMIAGMTQGGNPMMPGAPGGAADAI
jgi:hypothetical protein